VSAAWPDEAPTVKREPVSSRTLVVATRIARLAELASERLACSPDPDTILEALGDVSRILELAEDLTR
jgi:hypothetical protein